MLDRLMDPSTSTRRTPAARRRLAEHPVTTALLEAGLRLVLEELTADGEGGAAPRVFEAVSAARVCAAATRIGPLRATAGHLRDRWPHHGGYVEDLLAYGVWAPHWRTTLRAGEVAAAAVRGADPAAVAEELAGLSLHAGRDAVTHRLELLVAGLGAARPALREARRRGYGHLDATFGRFHQRLAAAHDPPALVAERTAATGCLVEGANVRLAALGGGPGARSAGVRSIVVGTGLLLASPWPDPSPSSAPGPAGGLPGPPELAEVLSTLTDPAGGTRRTTAGRRRLAEDAITRQLLEGGIAVLAEEFGVAGVPGSPPPGQVRASRAFDALSAARVIAVARSAGGAGAGATAAQLRDRWSVHGHYVDDLAGYALARHRPGVRHLLGPGAGADLPASAGQEVPDAVRAHLREAVEDPASRVKLLFTPLSGTRPGVAAALRRLVEAEESDVAELLALRLEATGRRLRDGLALEELASWVVALGDGAVVRLLATGGVLDAERDGSLLVRSVRGLLTAATEPEPEPAPARGARPGG